MRSIVALVLAALGAVLCVLADPTSLTVWTLCAATLAALGSRPGVLFGALTLVAGLAVQPAALPLIAPMALIGALLAGAALGLLGRELERHIDLLARDHRAVLVALAALLLLLTLVMPDPHVRLASGGMPAMFDALTIDTPSATRLWRPIPALVTYLSPLADLEPLALILSGIVAFAAMAHAALALPLDRAFQWVVRGTALLTVVVALVALLDLLAGSVTLDLEALRQTMTHQASTAGPLLDLAAPPDVALAWWSRPLVDGLRLVAALLLAYAPFMNARSETATTTLAQRPWLTLALAAAVVALPFMPVPMALAGGIALGLGALVAGRTGTSADLAPRLALVMVLVLWVWSAIARTPLG